jgi:hypothetical protein
MPHCGPIQDLCRPRLARAYASPLVHRYHDVVAELNPLDFWVCSSTESYGASSHAFMQVKRRKRREPLISHLGTACFENVCDRPGEATWLSIGRLPPCQIKQYRNFL